MRVEPGTRLGPYEITARLGAGGMGEVWSARDTRLDRAVAVKVLPAEFAQNVPLRLRFEREARAISQVNHPNICTLHDVGDGYLVMELLEGETLADRLLRGPLPMADVLRYGIQIAEALDRAHRAGIVHRDLKPGNIMLTRSGAKLLDFGLATRHEIVVASDTNTQHKPLTQEGTILGTFQYMAPEQLEGLQADPRTDIFALGALLYEMATGKRAFEGKTRTSLIAAIVGSEPRPIRELQPVTPAAFEHVILRALRKDPEERWQSAFDIASELRWISEASLQGADMPTASLGARRRERIAWSITLVLLLATIATAWFAFSGETRPQHAYEVAITPPAGGEFSFGSNLGWGVISPDGRHLVFRAATDEGTGLWVRSLARDDARLLPGTEGAFYPFWSPDSRWVGFFQLGSMNKSDISGGLPVMVTKAAQWGRGASWGDDGWIVFSPLGGSALMRVRADGGEATAVTALDPKRGENAHYWPALLPGGRSLLYFVRSESRDYEGIWFARLGEDGTAREPRRLIASSSSALYVPGPKGRGHVLWVEGERLMARAFDPESGSLSGASSDIGGPVRVHDSQRGAFLSASTEGTISFSPPASIPARLILLDRAGQTRESPELAGRDQYEPMVSPDGTIFAYVSVTGGTGNVWLYDLGRKSSWPLTSGNGYAENLAWSPDGKELAYAMKDAQGVQIIRARVPAGAKTVITTVRSGRFGPAEWSRHGYVIGRHETADHRSIVAALPLEPPHELTPLTDSGQSNANMAQSPDGRWLAYALETGGRTDVFVAAIESDGNRLSLGTAHPLPVRDLDSAVWARNGTELIAYRSDRFFYSIPVEVDGDGGIRFGAPAKLFRMSVEQANHAVTPDGETIIAKVNSSASHEMIRLLVNWQSRLSE